MRPEAERANRWRWRHAQAPERLKSAGALFCAELMHRLQSVFLVESPRGASAHSKKMLHDGPPPKECGVVHAALFTMSRSLARQEASLSAALVALPI
jgi:hypothetical protein